MPLKLKIKFKLYDLCSRLGEYCNNHPGDDLAYDFYLFFASIVF